MTSPHATPQRCTRRLRSRALALACATLAVATDVAAQPAAPARAQEPRRVLVDRDGVMRWADTREELRLFGANYAIGSSSDFRAAGAVGGDRKRMIDEDVAHFARMGWDGMRLAFWGDWQAADRQGNLLANAHLDLLDYLVAKAKERGIAILLNPIHTYHAGWPDAMRDTFPGFAAHMDKAKLGTDSAAIAAQVRYIGQLLRHVNPYTGVALKDEPAIVFVEMINEPVHHPADTAGQVRYIDALVRAVRDAGSPAVTFHNVSQDFRIAEAIRRSTVQGASFGWYPTGLNAGRELRGNTLRTVDDYPAFRMPELAGRPRLVYEFDSADQLTGYMYPAMVRAFRQGGVQLAAMFAYDMLATASRNLGWQTHRLNLVYTPRKAMSAVIAAEAMRRLPRGGDAAPYPRNARFGDFRVSHEENLAELVATDAFMHTGTTTSAPRDRRALRRVYGVGSSPVVRYEGEGAYFLDRLRDGTWRLELYPDAVDVDDPFEMPRRDKVVTRVIHRAWPMTIDLPDLGPGFTAQPLVGGTAEPMRAEGGRVVLRPGVYVLAANGRVDPATLPARVGAVGLREWHVPPTDTLATRVLPDASPQAVAGTGVTIGARVVTDSMPDAVTLWVRPLGRGWYTPFPMQRATAYGWRATLAGDTLRAGPHEWLVSVRHGTNTVTFPDGVRRAPGDWDFHADSAWRLGLVTPRTPLRLLDPARDAKLLAFTRIGDAGRSGLFRVVPSEATGESALHVELPVVPGEDQPDDYTASLVVADRVAARGAAMDGASAVRVRLRGIAPGQRMHLTLMETDGTSWSAVVTADTAWTERTIPLADFRIARGVHLPLGYPGRWNYWVPPAEGRGGTGDRVRARAIERVQLSLRPIAGVALRPGGVGVEVESVVVVFE